MFDALSDEYVANSMDDLASTVGIREDAQQDRFLSLLSARNVKECIKAIARHLGLPVEIELSYVADAEAGGGERFESRDLARVDAAHGRTEGIFAQVLIPHWLPLYGTSALEGFRIRVRVSDSCLCRPQTFVACIAHELSHVLLSSLLHPQKDNEVYADLTPILLGLGKIIERGRKAVGTVQTGNVVTTTTTRYGYLSDRQFAFARRRVKSLCADYVRRKSSVLKQARRGQRQLSKLQRRLDQFRMFLRYLDDHSGRRVRPTDGERIVQFHWPGHGDDWEVTVRESGVAFLEADRYVRPLAHYTKGALNTLDAHARTLADRTEEVTSLLGRLTEDVRVLRRNVSAYCRFRAALHNLGFARHK